jgi:hypothetical protein
MVLMFCDGQDQCDVKHTDELLCSFFQEQS